MTDRARLERAVDDVRRRWAPDARLAVFDVTLDPRTVDGVVTSREALDALRRLAADAGLEARVRLLPDASAGTDLAGIVTAAIAPLLDGPGAHARRVTEALHGERVAVLERRDSWLRVRVPDGYHAWMHEGYAATGPDEWADDWDARAGARALGAELRLEDGRIRLPHGARVAVRRGGAVEAADGRVGEVVAGIVRTESELRAEARHVAAPEWALRWFGGAPYAWGGRTEWGVDCSGLVQATYAARGAALPRDADQQLLVGREIPAASDGAGYQAGDLLFFAAGGRVAHVALWLGAGRIAHAALARGGVSRDDLFGNSPLARQLRPNLVAVKRLSFSP